MSSENKFAGSPCICLNRAQVKYGLTSCEDLSTILLYSYNVAILLLTVILHKFESSQTFDSQVPS